MSRRATARYRRPAVARTGDHARGPALGCRANLDRTAGLLGGGRRRRGACLAIGAALAALAVLARPGSLAARSAARPPELQIRAMPSMRPYAAALERFDTHRLLAIMRLVGLDDPGGPIPVVLVPPDSPLAAQTPEWIAGFARRDGLVVLFPERTPSYPHESIQEVLQHEVAHVLIDRAAGGRPLPRWFHEGVALAAERTWSLGDRTQFAYEVAFGGPASVASLDRLFEASPGAMARAYSLSGAFVQDLLQTSGADLPARVLAAMKAGRSFREAFQVVTGTTVDEAGDTFWRRRRLWVTWLPWLTSPGTVYALITLLALAAILRMRARRSARRREEEPPPPADPPVTIH